MPEALIFFSIFCGAHDERLLQVLVGEMEETMVTQKHFPGQALSGV